MPPNESIDEFKFCNLHGCTCPSFKGGKYNLQPLCTELGAEFPYRNMPLDNLLAASNSECVIEKTFALVIMIRRRAGRAANNFHIPATKPVNVGIGDIDSDQLWCNFITHIVNNFWVILNQSSTRILISLLDCFSDMSPKALERSNATMCSASIRHELAAHSTMVKRSSYNNDKLIWDTVQIPNLKWVDSIVKSMVRMRSNLFYTPIVWLIYHEIMNRMLDSGQHTLCYLDKFSSAVRRAPLLTLFRRLLRPSSMNDDQIGLYYQSHAEKKNYGGRRFMPPEIPITDKMTVLDFGCGKGRIRQNCDMNITSYDPATIDVLPTGKFDVVMTLDVMEHVPLDNLSSFFQWLEIYAKKNIWMLIATVKAKHILPDNTNAHAIIKPADWWLERCKEELPSFKITRKSQVKQEKEKSHVLLLASKS